MKTESTVKKARVIAFKPDGEYYYQKGMIAYQKGDLYRAKKFVGRAIEFEPDETEYLCQQASIMAELDDHEASIEVLKRVVYELDERLTECYFFMANNYAYLGQYEEALTEIKRYISNEPKGSFIHEARELYKLLVYDTEEEEEPKQFVLDHETGRQALETGQYEKAMHYLKSAIKENPSFWAAYNNLAIAYYSQGDIETAFETLDKVLIEDPGNVHALCNRATFCYQMEDPDLQMVVPTLETLHPIYPEHRSKLGATFFFIGNYELAYRWLKSAERTSSQWETPFYYWLAISAYKMNRVNEAVQTWKKANQLTDMPFEPLEYGKIKRLFLDDDVQTNPIVRSLIIDQFKQGSMSGKIFSLVMLRRFADQEAVSVLQEQVTKKNNGYLVDEIAQRILNAISHSAGQDPRFAIVDYLEKCWSGGFPLVKYYDVYSIWSELFFLDTDEFEDVDAKALAAAIEYCYKKDYSIKVTQSELIKRYGLTQYRLRMHIEKVKALGHLEYSE